MVHQALALCRSPASVVLCLIVTVIVAAVIAVQRRKLGMLNFSAAAGIDTDAVLLLYLIAAADPQEPVSR